MAPRVSEHMPGRVNLVTSVSLNVLESERPQALGRESKHPQALGWIHTCRNGLIFEKKKFYC